MMVEALVNRLKEAGMEVVGECRTTEQCLALYATHTPDLVLCDVGLGKGEGTGIQLTEKLVAAHPGAQVLMYSGYTGEDLIHEAIEKGARGYIRKSASIPDLIACLTAAAAGESEVFDRETSREIVRSFQRRAAEPARNPNRLTPREQEVLELIVVEGKTTNKEIAKSLTLSTQTVKSHLENIMGKLAVTNRAQLINKAHTENLVGGRGDRSQLPNRP